MTSDERLALDILIESSRLEAKEDFDRYLEATRKLPISDDPVVLDVMLDCLNAIDAGEIQYELVEAIERFPDEVYVRGVLMHARRLVDKAGVWGWMIIQTMLNTSSCLNIAIGVYTQLSNRQKTEFKTLLDELCRSDRRYDEQRQMFI